MVGCEGAVVLGVIGVVLVADVAGDKDNTRAREDPEEGPSFIFAIISVKEEEGNINGWTTGMGLDVPNLNDVEDERDGEDDGENNGWAFNGGLEVTDDLDKG